jgi:hypothetical protein
METIRGALDTLRERNLIYTGEGDVQTLPSHPILSNLRAWVPEGPMIHGRTLQLKWG